MRFETFNNIYDTLVGYEPKLSFWFKVLHHEDELSLDHLSIGTLLDAVKSTSPKEMFEIINNEIKLKLLTDDDKIFVFYRWKEDVERINAMFDALERNNPTDNKYGMLWNKIAERIPVQPEIALIDNIAKRMNVSWKEAQKLEWAEAYLMLAIDKRTALFDEAILKETERRK